MHIVGIDTGGTFTDCVVIGADGRITCDKALTTPSDLSAGLIDAAAHTARGAGFALEALLADTRFIAHGTTQGLNRLYTRTGAKVGLLTTRGHEDTLAIGRVFQKVAGLGEREITAAFALRKASPLVPRSLIHGITERIDADGDVIVRLDEDDARSAIGRLRAAGVESFAIALLWSFMNPAHEARLKALVCELAPGCFVTASSELSPVMGEYERTATTVINAYLGPTTHAYLRSLEARLAERRLKGPVLVMQSNGGVVPTSIAADEAVRIVSSGPVGGVVGAALLGRELGTPSIITTDVGGTSFDVGLVVDGEPVLASQPTLDHYAVQIPMIDVRSIGAGGGSLAWIESSSGLLRVGPKSAGAQPGPVCYGRGGEQPTVTDANLVLGRLDPARFFGGRMRLDAEAAEHAIRTRIAAPLGLSLLAAAQGIIDIVDAHMTDLVHKLTIERGWDPRDFVLYAFGGGGPVHVGAYGAELGVAHALISPYAPMFSAFGMASAGITRHYVRAKPAAFPPEAADCNRIFAELEARAQAEAARDAAMNRDQMRLRRFVDMRFQGQVHEIRVPVPDELDRAGVLRLRDDFERAFQRMYGAGTAASSASVEVVNYGVVSYVPVPRPPLPSFAADGADPRAAELEVRPVWFRDRHHDTRVYDAARLLPGNRVAGPALVHDAATTTVVHPGQRLEVDRYRNLMLFFR